MTDQDRQLMMEAAAALGDAKRLWPARHPAAGMIVGIENDCQEVYQRLAAVQAKLFERAAFKEAP